jgi:hypothetical protein
MPETRTIYENVERRTYLRGTFVGKIEGELDKIKSDLIHENFFDLEFLSAEINTDTSKIRKWNEGGEFEDFVLVPPFPSLIPSPTNVNIIQDDGRAKHYKLILFEPKIKDLMLHKQLYDREKLFVTLEGELCGYLKHNDVVEREEEISPEENSAQILDKDESVSPIQTISTGEPASAEKNALADTKESDTSLTTETANPATTSPAGGMPKLPQFLRNTVLPHVKTATRAMNNLLDQRIPGYSFVGKSAGYLFGYAYRFLSSARFLSLSGCFEALFVILVGIYLALIFILIFGVLIAGLFGAIYPYWRPILIVVALLFFMLTLRKNVAQTWKWVVPALFLIVLFFLGLFWAY